MVAGNPAPGTLPHHGSDHPDTRLALDLGAATPAPRHTHINMGSFRGRDRATQAGRRGLAKPGRVRCEGRSRMSPCSHPRVPDTGARVMTTQAPVPSNHRRVPITQAPVPATQAPVPITQARVPITRAPVPITQARVPITQAPVPITQARVPITQARVPITQCQSGRLPRNCFKPAEDGSADAGVTFCVTFCPDPVVPHCAWYHGTTVAARSPLRSRDCYHASQAAVRGIGTQPATGPVRDRSIAGCVKRGMGQTVPHQTTALGETK